MKQFLVFVSIPSIGPQDLYVRWGDSKMFLVQGGSVKDALDSLLTILPEKDPKVLEDADLGDDGGYFRGHIIELDSGMIVQNLSDYDDNPPSERWSKFGI